MAEEVGVGYVSLVPSLKNFSKLVKAELKKQFGKGVEVPVTPVFDDKGFDDTVKNLPTRQRPKVPVELDPLTEALQAELRKVTRTLARTLAVDIPVNPETEGLRRELTVALDEAQAGLKAEIPVDPEGRAAYRAKLKALLESTREKQHVKVELDYDVDKDRLGQAIRKAEPEAKEGGGLLARLFTAGFGDGLLNPLIGIPVVVAAALLAPLAGAAVASATIAGAGLGAIFAAAFGLRADKDIRAGASGLLAQMNTLLTEAAQPFKKPFLQAFSIIGDALKDIAPDVKSFFETIADSGVVQELARGIGGFLRAFTETGALDKLGSAIVPVLQQLAMALPDLGNAFAQFLISISQDGKGTTAADFLGKLLRGLADAIRFTGDLIGFLMGQFEGTIAIMRTIGQVVGWVITGFKTLNDAMHGSPDAIRAVISALTDLAGIIWHAVAEQPQHAVEAFKGVVDWIKRLFEGVRKSASDKFAAVVGLAKGLPGQIKSALGNLGSLLLNAGKNVVQGLIDGIKSKFGALGDIASQMAQTIRNYLPFSPAKEGPLSGSGNPYHSGQVIAGDVAKGVQSQLPAVTSAANQLAGAFSPGSAGFTTGPGAGVGLTVDSAGSRLDDLLMEIIREVVRVKYHGDPNLAFKPS